MHPPFGRTVVSLEEFRAEIEALTLAVPATGHLHLGTPLVSIEFALRHVGAEDATKR